MSTLLEEPTVQSSTSPSQRLRTTTAAIRLAFVWFGIRKSLTSQQKAQAAESFGAEGQYLTAGKKLFDTTHPAFKAVTGIKNRIVSLWKAMSLPYVEPGIRLIPMSRIETFNTQLTELQEELNEAVWRLDEHFAELREAARDRLGSLYNESDYPESLQGLFEVSWDFPSVEPPPYLQQLNPELYRQECERVSARFDEAVQLAEQAFVDELANLVSHLNERLTGQADGKPKIFRDSAITNLTEFFDRFKQLNIGSSQQLDDLVENAQQVIQGRDPQQLRDNRVLRQSVAQELGEVQNVLDGLLVDRPRRNILRRPK